MNPVPSAGRIYWPQLDGLRFLAAILVFVHHAPLPAPELRTLQEIGWVGVDLFLVLSAFLITRLLKEEYRSTGTISVWKYFLRRALRIWPLYWTYVTAMFWWFVTTGMESLRYSFGVWLSHLTFINNLIVAKVGYGGDLPYSSHLWTLSLEEQFYVVIPLVFPLLMAQSYRRVGAVAAGLMVLLALMRLACLCIGIKHPFYWTLPLRADAMVLGTALGIGVFDRVVEYVRGEILFAAGVALVAYSTSFGDPGSMELRAPLLFSCADAGCLLMVMGCLGHGFLRRLLAIQPLAYLGKISFGIYVYHLIALDMAPSILADRRFFEGVTLNSPRGFAVALALTCVLATGSYELYEKWFLKLKKRFEIIASRPA